MDTTFVVVSRGDVPTKKYFVVASTNKMKIKTPLLLINDSLSDMTCLIILKYSHLAQKSHNCQQYLLIPAQFCNKNVFSSKYRNQCTLSQ